MSNESEISVLYEDNDTIEEKRRKNVIDNQNFLQSLQLFNVRDDLKLTVNSVITTKKASQKKHKRKEIIDESEMRRSSRIQSMFRPNYNPDETFHTKDLMILTDDTSTDQDGEEEEEDDDLTSAFTTKIDKDWMPVHSEKPVKTATRPVRKAAKKVSGGVKIFMPNTGLEASSVLSKDKPHKSHVSKRLNVAISSSSSESED